MRKLYKTLLIIALLPALCLNAQLTKQSSTKKITPVVVAEKSRATGGVINNNAKIIVGTGAGITVTGNYTTNTSGLATLSGTGFLKLTGDFVNNNTSGNPLDASSIGSVIFNGTTAQTIGGTAATSFYGMTISNTAGVLMTKNVTNEKNLVFTAGKLNVGSNILLLRATSAITGADATKFIIATGTGSVEKGVNAAGSFTLPLGDNTDTEEYSPLTFNFASGSFTSGFSKVKASVINAKNSNVTESTNFINRYWKVSQDAIPTFSCTLTGTYTTADVTGTENHIWGAFHNGTAFINGVKADGTNNLVSATVTSFGAGGILTGKQGNNLPSITSTAVTTGTQGIAYTYTLTATDADGDGLSYSTVGVVPSWLSFSWQTQTLSGTPTNANIGNNAVTLRVSDAYGYTDQIFNINVANVNDAPTISDIADAATDEDVSKLISFTVADIDNPVADLSLSATSSNTALVPVANIVFGGSGADRTATITPVANQNGTATITITVSDGVKRSTITISDVNSKKQLNSKKAAPLLSTDSKATASDSFVLTVNSINDAPVCGTNPAITGLSYIGATITGNSGTWNDVDLPSQTIAYAYQWQRADNSSFSIGLTNISGATSANYVITSADQNKYLRLRVTATDNGTPNMAGIAYSNTLTITIPTISGIKTVGSGGDYPTLNGESGLFTAINRSIVTGNITAKIISDVAETVFTQLTQWSETGAGGYRLRIVPDALIHRTVSGNLGGMIILWGADRVTIDGTKDKLLTFDNSNNSTGSVSPFLLYNSDNDSILNCTIKSVNPSSTSLQAVTVSGSTGLVISKNKFYNLSSGPAANVTAIDCNSSSATINISNNMITLTPATTGKVIGIENSASGTTALNVYYNSVYIGGTQTGSANSYAFGKTASITNLRLKDNIFYNARTNSAKAGTGKHYALYMTNVDGLTDCDYNLLYSAAGNIGRSGSTDYATLANWSYLTGWDDYSQSSTLTFENLSTGDLSFTRVATNAAVFDKGTPITGITDDYFSKSRTSLFYSQVDIGAYELPQSSDIEDGILPLVTSLAQNYPNPFNPVTEINYQLAAMSNVKLAVFNAKGELVKTLVNCNRSAGHYRVSFDGAGFNSGLYFYKLEADGKCIVKRMLMVK